MIGPSLMSRPARPGLVLRRAIGERLAQIGGCLPARGERRRLVAAEIVRRLLHVADRLLELADRRGHARVLGALARERRAPPPAPGLAPGPAGTPRGPH